MCFDYFRFNRKLHNIRYENEESVKSALCEMGIYLLFVVVTTIIALSTQHLQMFFLNKTIRDTFAHKASSSNFTYVASYSSISSIIQWWSFVESNYLEDLHGVFGNGTNNTQAKTDDAGENIILDENVLLGPPRLRQIRVKPNTCTIHEIFDSYFNNCYDDYDSSIEDHSDFQGSRFYTLDELNATRVWAVIHTYVGGGFIVDLTYNYQTNMEIIRNLKTSKWLDRGTRLVLIETTMYNPNIEVFNNVKFIIEMPPSGGVVPSISTQCVKMHVLWTDGKILHSIAGVLFYLLIVNYSIEEIMEMWHCGPKKYVKSIWNMCDLLIIIIGILSFVYNIWHPKYLDGLLRWTEGDIKEHCSIDILCYWNRVYTDLMSICAFITWIKIFKYISFNKTMLQFSLTLKTCAKDLLGFGVMFAIVFVAYAELGMLLFGSTNEDFRNFQTSILTMMRMILGDFNYMEIERSNRVLGPIFFLSYILLVFFILLNMFLAIINDTYKDVKSVITQGENHLQKFFGKKMRQIYNQFTKRKDKKKKSIPDVDQSQSDIPHFSGRLRDDEIVSQFMSDFYQPNVESEYFEEVHTEPTDPLLRNDEYYSLVSRLEVLEGVMEHLIDSMDMVLEKANIKRPKRFGRGS